MSYSLLERSVNSLYKLYNRAKLSILGVQYGKGLCIHGHICIDKNRNSRIDIGDNVYISSGRHMNPLSRNIEASFRVEENGVLEIGNNVGLSSVVLWCHEHIKIGNNVNIGANTILLDSDCHSLNYIDRRNITIDLSKKKNSPIEIGNDVLIGVNCVILKGVTIGDRSIIGAGSVVTKDVPADNMAAGNPAVVI